MEGRRTEVAPMTSSAHPLIDRRSTLDALPRQAGGARVERLARRWAEYRYPDTRVAHLAGYALLQAGALLLADRVRAFGLSAGAILALGLFVAALRVHVAPALVMGAAHAAFLAAGRALEAAAPGVIGPSAIASVAFGVVILASARHVYQDIALHADPSRGGWRGALDRVCTGGALELLFVLLRRGSWPDLREALTERAVLRLASSQDRPWRNWARTHAWRASRVWFPRAASDLVEIVALARAERRRVRVVGTAYSWEPIAATDDFLVCPCLMREVRLDLSDPRRPRAVVEVGANGRELNRRLESAGYALPSNVVMETVSWGGMISVGAHGSGWGEGTLSDMVEAVELVDGRGRPRRFERGVDPDHALDAVRVALGLCGVIHRITLRVVPAFHVALKDDLVPVREALDGLAREVPAHDYYDVYWFPFADEAWIRAWDRTHRPRSPRPLRGPWSAQTNRTQWGLWHGALQMVWGEPFDWLLARFPSWTRLLGRIKMPRTKVGARVCHVHDATHFRTGIEHYRVGCAEVAFAIDPGFDSVRRAWSIVDDAARRWAAAGKFPLNMTVNARFVGGSSCLLSPAHGNERTCYVEILGGLASPDWKPFVDEVLTAWMEQLPNARVHWGKQYGDVPGIAALVRRSLGDDLARFLQIRRELDLDPDDLFVNPFLDRLLLKDLV
jgi:hypothetical protein